MARAGHSGTNRTLEQWVQTKPAVPEESPRPMPTVRTTCPNCEIITIDAMIVTVRRRSVEDHAECMFVCPACLTEVVQPVADRMVPALIGAGCSVEDWTVSDARALHPSSSTTPPLTEGEIDMFVQALDHDDWFDELHA